MKFIIDANIIISALIKQKNNTAKIIINNKFLLITPDFLLLEINKYKKEICKKSGLSLEEIEILITILFKHIEIIPLKNYQKYLKQAKEICPDENDVCYFALALRTNTHIWSNDKALKNQNKSIKHKRDN